MLPVMNESANPFAMNRLVAHLGIVALLVVEQLHNCYVRIRTAVPLFFMIMLLQRPVFLDAMSMQMSMQMSMSRNANTILSSLSSLSLSSSLSSLSSLSSRTVQSSTSSLLASSNKELFSVAPMMGHTNRHYRHFFRQLSNHSFLYTEMIPAGQIVRAYEQALQELHLYDYGAGETTEPNGIGIGIHDAHDCNYHPERLLQVAEHLQQNIIKQQPLNSYVLEELLHPGQGSIALQLGGRNPDILAKAAAIGSAFGFSAINLNCGCPSSSVASERQTGAALMMEPELVARCCEQMSHRIDMVNPSVELSVKHRLGIRMANAYDAEWDRRQSDEQTYQECKSFLNHVGYAGKVSKVHVHARLAILGLDAAAAAAAAVSTEETEDGSSSSLWTPSVIDEADESSSTTDSTRKINHKRVQYFAKRKARQATIQNRNIPPLRPNVVNQIAEDFPHLQVLTNGGISSISELEDRLSHSSSSNTPILGAMVGRAAINHPCSFAGVDHSLWAEDPSFKPTRKQVLDNYIAHCEREEERMKSLSTNDLKLQRKKLTAAPFHLFMGEPGNNAFQRRLRKLVSRGDRHPAHAMLQAAMADVPIETLEKRVDQHVPLHEIETYDFTKRSGSMQRTIY